ncbi:MAG TPA: glycosyltransferase 87 family protein, partial [Anaerolineae bacterium]|nr:glycosyltransferase 87 family protein [Anaerolineae bacterium]
MFGSMLAKRASASWNRLGAAPPLTWVLAGLGAAYLLFFIYPIFLAGPVMRSLPTLPAMSPIGSDLEWALEGARGWFATGGSPYTRELLYTPVGYLLLWPLQLLTARARFVVMTCLTLAAYSFCTLAVPLRVLRAKVIPSEVLLIFATGALSYGLQFELERGQQNVVALALVLAAVWAFHDGQGRRAWAYILFIAAVQLKIWPAVFVFCLTSAWRDWRGNSLRWLGLGLLNIVLLFIFLPLRAVADFFASGWWMTSSTDFIFVVTHSIHAFAVLVGQHAALRGDLWLAGNTGLIEVAFMGLTLACLAAVFAKRIRSGGNGLSVDLLLLCALAAVLLPGQSQDYKLAILAGPVAGFLASLPSRFGDARPRISIALTLSVFSFCYGAILLPTAYKPHRLLLENNMPALFLMLVTFSVLVL